MAIKKKTVVLSDTTATELALGAAYAMVHKLHVLASADTTTSVTIVDADSQTVATVASGNYTTKTQFFLTPVEATVFDSAGEVMTADGDASVGIMAASPLTLTAGGIGSGTQTVDVFFEV